VEQEETAGVEVSEGRARTVGMAVVTGLVMVDKMAVEAMGKTAVTDMASAAKAVRVVVPETAAILGLVASGPTNLTRREIKQKPVSRKSPQRIRSHSNRINFNFPRCFRLKHKVVQRTFNLVCRVVYCFHRVWTFCS
jgi:hypothetical protein